LADFFLNTYTECCVWWQLVNSIFWSRASIYTESKIVSFFILSVLYPSCQQYIGQYVAVFSPFSVTQPVPGNWHSAVWCVHRCCTVLLSHPCQPHSRRTLIRGPMSLYPRINFRHWWAQQLPGWLIRLSCMWTSHRKMHSAVNCWTVWPRQANRAYATDVFLKHL